MDKFKNGIGGLMQQDQGVGTNKTKAVFDKPPVFGTPKRLAPREENVSLLLAKSKRERRKEFYTDDAEINARIDELFNKLELIYDKLHDVRDCRTRYVSKTSSIDLWFLELDIIRQFVEFFLTNNKTAAGVSGKSGKREQSRQSREKVPPIPQWESSMQFVRYLYK